LRFPTVEATKLRLNILDSKSCPLISNIEVYKAPIVLTPPAIIRDKEGFVSFQSGDKESEIYYTLDGSQPTSRSPKYTTPVKTADGKVEIKAISYNPFTKQSSIVGEESFDISRKSWKIVEAKDINANQILDGNSNTSWHQKNGDLVIDLGKQEKISGFRYLPAQNWWEEGSIITHFQFSTSTDGINWKLASEGEFSNIKNNPFWQTKTFEPVQASYIRFTPMKTVNPGSDFGIAEFDLITKE
jgi:alpha-L-fucosidase